MQLLGILVTVTIFSMMLSIGLNNSVRDLTTLWRDRALFFRSILAVVVIVPLVFFLLIVAFDLSAGVSSGLVLLAAAVGAPLTTKRASAAGADLVYVSSLQVSLAILTVLVAPVLLAIAYASFDLVTEHVGPMAVARQVATVTLLPLLVGLGLKYYKPGLATKVVEPLNRISNILFLVLVVALIGAVVALPDLRSQLLIGWPGTFAIVIIVLVSLAVGHLIGGPDQERRNGLAIVCVARNVGLALYIANLSESSLTIIPTIIVYMLLGAFLAIPYSIWAKRR